MAKSKLCVVQHSKWNSKLLNRKETKTSSYRISKNWVGCKYTFQQKI